MAEFRQTPYAPVPYGYRSGGTIAELLARRGDIAAQGALQSGQAWSNAAQQIGQIAGQAVQAHAEEKQQSKRDAALTQLVESGLWQSDPKAAFTEATRILGPREGPRFFEGLAGASRLMQAQQGGLDPSEAMKALPMLARGMRAAPPTMRPGLYSAARGLMIGARLVSPEQMPEQYTAELDPFIEQLAGDDGKLVTTVGPDGKPVQRMATPTELRTGVELYEKAPEPKAQTLDQMLSAAYQAGDQQKVGEILALKAREASATRAPQQPSTTRMWVVRDGKPIRISEAEYQPGDLPASNRDQARPATGREKKVLGFYLRGKSALDTITAAPEGGSSLEDEMAASTRNQMQLATGMPLLQSAAQQRYQQAQRAFTEARLRNESGAAVPQSEYDNDAKTYFVQPGDSAATIKQKRESRQKVLDGLKYESGRALAEYYGEGAEELAPTGSQYPNTGPNPRIDPEVQRRLDRLQNLGKEKR